MVADDAVTRVAALLATEATTVTVGRTRERARLAELIEADDPVVVFVHGAGGIGKTSLVRATLEDVGAAHIWLDARHVEPTATGLLAALSAAVGMPCADPDGAGSAIAASSIDVLVVDDYQRFAVIDGWLRNELLPSMPTGITTLIVGRNAPNLAWRASPGWRHLVADMLVGPLGEAEATELVGRHRLDPALARRALDFGRGHPLALELAADAFSRRPQTELHPGPPPEAVEELVDVLLDDLDASTKRLVDAACVLRRITQPLLAAVLDDRDGSADDAMDDTVDSATAWRTIRELPFVRVRPNGLEMQPVIQEVVATSLELRDPGRTRALRRRAGRAALAEVERAPGWEATADLLHLVQNHVIRDAFLPPAGLQHPVERAHRDDVDAVSAVSIAHDGEASRPLIVKWWRAHQDAFHVLRAGDGGVRAFSIVAAVDTIDRELLRADPVLTVVSADLSSRPLDAGSRALVLRRALSVRTGDRISAELAPMIIDLKRTYLSMRPHLARVYTVVGDWPRGSATSRAMGFEPRGDPVSVGDRSLQVLSLDFGPGSVDGWLARHVDMETAQLPERPDDSIGESPADGGTLRRLSAREREVLSAMAEGLTNRQLADRLFISERTANRHISNIFTKLGVHNRTAAARIAIDAGLR